jgi:hypothetical protein
MGAWTAKWTITWTTNPAHRSFSGGRPQPWWLEKIERERGRFLRVASRLGVATEGVDGEIDRLVRTLRGSRYRSFVHGDLSRQRVTN